MVLKCFTINRESRSGEREILWEMMHLYILQKRGIQKMIEALLQMMDYKKCGEVFYCGNDAEYKYFSGIRVWQM